MIEATIALGTEPLGQYLATNAAVPVYQRAAMSQAYNLTCKDGKRIGLHMSSPDKFWASFCNAIERPEWVAKYPKRMDRVTHYESLAIEIAAVFKTKTRAQWVSILEAADVPFAPELALEELASDPHIAHLDVFYETMHPKYGPVRAPHRAIRADGSRAIDHRPPPDLGEHTDEVLRELGVGAECLTELRAKGIV
jgi:crotonobetainyl-CoA:carnitine CoA-transferase CaiB-like acyl-CoA transferase